MPNILRTIQDLIKGCLSPGADAPPLPTILEGLATRLTGWLSAEPDPSPDGFERWLGGLRSAAGDDETRETLLVRVLQTRLPRLAESLVLLGAITAVWQEADGVVRPRSFRIAWGVLADLARRPGAHALGALLARVQGVDDAKALQVLLLLLITGPGELVGLEYRRRGFLALPQGDDDALRDLVDLVNSPVFVPLGPALAQEPATLADLLPGNAAPHRIELHGPDAFNPAAPLDGLGLTIVADAASVRALDLPLWGSAWRLRGEAAGSGNVTARVGLDGGTVDTSQAGHSSARLGLSLGRDRHAGDDALLLGDRGGTHVAVGDVRVGVTFSATEGEPVFGLTLRLSGLRLGVGADVLKPVAMGLPLPGSVTFGADVALPFLQGVGLATGAPGAGLLLGIDIPRHLGLSIGGSGAGLWVDDLLVRIEVAPARGGLAFRVLFRLGARAELGPLKATMNGAGAWLGRWTTGNAGVLAPTGIGLSLSAGPISGGGFFERLGPGEYAGALRLSILGIGAFAYGIYKEVPGAVSFVAVIGIRLPPPGIQIGFGFAVSGFGGLIGINRRADMDKLRDRLVSGTAGDVLFTDDPTRNAPRILGAMRELFPDERGVHVFGPTLQLNWLYIIKLDVGLFIELPGPRKIFVAGSGRLVVGSEDFALVYFRLDFIGGVDLTASLIFFDGALVNSHILGILRITGGIALRLGVGANPFFLFSIGGFHPSFTPAGMSVPQIPRAGAGVDLGIVWFRQETYYAVTSNTVQFGARTEAGVEIGPIKVHGWFGFDAIVQLKPFRFEASIDDGMAASFEGLEFASIRVRGQLSGPGPLVLRASASVKVLVRISKSVTLTLDKRPPEAVPAIANLAEHLRGEISAPANLRGEGEDDCVVPRASAGGDAAVCPTGDVVWEQRRVPLDRLLHKVEARPLDPPRTLGVGVVGAVVAPEHDLFAVGSTTDLSDAEALSGPGFSQGRSGFRLGLRQEIKDGPICPYAPTVEVVRLPARNRFTSPVHLRLSAGLLSALAEVTGPAVGHEAPRVAVRDEPWRVQGDGTDLMAADAFLAGRAAGVVAAPASAPAVSLAGVL